MISKRWPYAWPLLLIASLMAILLPGLVAMHYVQNVIQGVEAHPPLRVTQGQTMRQCDGARVSADGRDWPQPLARVESANLKGTWQAVDLSHRAPQGADAGLLTVTGPEKRATCVHWFRFNLPADFSTAHPLWLHAAHLYSSGPVAMYVNGQRVYYTQTNGMTWAATYKPVWTMLGIFNGKGPHELLLRLSSFQVGTVHLPPLWLGMEESLRWKQLVREIITNGVPGYFSATFYFASIYLLLLWWRKPTLRILLRYVLLAQAGFFAHFVENIFDHPILNDWYAWFRSSLYLWWFVATHFMLKTLHRRHRPWLNRSVVGLSVFGMLVTLPFVNDLPFMPLVNPLSLLLPMTLAPLVLGFSLYDGWHRSRSALWLTLMNLAILIAALRRSLMLSDPESFNLTGYVYVITLLILAVILSRSYLRVLHKERAARARLKTTLAKQKEELQLNYAKLRESEREKTLTQERTRMMQDMHDGLGSSLHSALRSVERGNLSNAEVSEILKDCIDDLRIAIDSIEPVQVDFPLLLATLRFRLGDRLEEQGIHLQWEMQSVHALDWLDPGSSLHILRILQEAFTNVMKHTQADTIVVNTFNMDDAVGVHIIDNGGGFDFSKALSKGGKGLHNQMRRAQSVDAKISWRAVPGGTCLALLLPLHRASNAE